MDVLSHLSIDENARSERLIENESFGETHAISEISFKGNDIAFNILNKATKKIKKYSTKELFHDGITLFSLSKEDICKISYQVLSADK